MFLALLSSPAHFFVLSLVFKPPPKERKKDNLVVHWNILKQNYIGGGMKYNDSDDSLFIPEDGFYVIYLQMSYRSMHSFNICNNGVLHLTQSVAVLRMRHADRPVDIITNWETVSCDKDVWFKTIHNMARVLLRKGDRLQVRHSLNADSLIDFAGTPGTKTFWGVYLD